nr:PREDICTED: N-acetylaspartate synthetase [Bos mutus]
MLGPPCSPGLCPLAPNELGVPTAHLHTSRSEALLLRFHTSRGGLPASSFLDNRVVNQPCENFCEHIGLVVPATPGPSHPSSQLILLGPEVQLERCLCDWRLLHPAPSPRASPSGWALAAGPKSAPGVFASQAPGPPAHFASTLATSAALPGWGFSHSTNSPVLGPPPPHSGVWAGVSLCSEDPHYPRWGPVGLCQGLDHCLKAPWPFPALCRLEGELNPLRQEGALQGCLRARRAARGSPGRRVEGSLNGRMRAPDIGDPARGGPFPGLWVTAAASLGPSGPRVLRPGARGLLSTLAALCFALTRSLLLTCLVPAGLLALRYYYSRKVVLAYLDCALHTDMADIEQYYMKPPGSWELLRMSVDSRFRGRGIAKALGRKVLEFALAHDYSAVVLGTTAVQLCFDVDHPLFPFRTCPSSARTLLIGVVIQAAWATDLGATCRALEGASSEAL